MQKEFQSKASVGIEFLGWCQGEDCSTNPNLYWEAEVSTTTSKWQLCWSQTWDGIWNTPTRKGYPWTPSLSRNLSPHPTLVYLSWFLQGKYAHAVQWYGILRTAFPWFYFYLPTSRKVSYARLCKGNRCFLSLNYAILRHF